MPLATTDPAIEQTIVHQQARIRQLEAADQQRAVDLALSTAIDQTGHNFTPGAREQLVKLLRSEVGHVTTADGRLALAGPGFQPVGDFVRARLSDPDWSHFVRSGGGPSAPAGQVGHAGQVAGAPTGGQVLAQTLGDVIIERHQQERANRAAAAPANRDMGQAWGLRPAR